MCIKPHNWETLKRLLHEEDFLAFVVQISIWLLMSGMYAFSERQLLLNTPLSNVLTEALDSYALGSWLCLGRAVFFFDDSFTCVWWPCSCVWPVARLAGIDAPDGLKHVWLLFSCGQLSLTQVPQSWTQQSVLELVNAGLPSRWPLKISTVERRIPYRLMLLKILLVKFVLPPFD